MNRKDKAAEQKKLNKVENKESFEFVKQGIPLAESSPYSYPNFPLYPLRSSLSLEIKADDQDEIT